MGGGDIFDQEGNSNGDIFDQETVYHQIGSAQWKIGPTIVKKCQKISVNPGKFYESLEIQNGGREGKGGGEREGERGKYLKQQI